ncbi:ATP-binding protein [Kitasatospora sp. NBC_01287]|uniref:sensor histidine kinase n=1 Tax=Kitasatospora sp. NBC_01287 TaxID=2903573 RepID=UPI002252C2B1|nr:ATP-binding protein [Kitasatospora sp. NBC_01287]MCX4746494.1 ATP-binding protein [Kitasatospora sp. NBC_01287]
MTARSRLSGRPAALLAALVAVGAAGAALAVAVSAAPPGERSVVGLWGAVAAAVWSVAAVLGLAQRRRARRLAGELAVSRGKGEAALAAVLRAEAATASATAQAQAARARANAAHTEAEAARVEMLAARSEAVEARSEAAAARAAADDERAELVLLAERTVPEVVRLLRAGASVETVLVAHRQTAHEDLIGLLAKEIAYGERQRAAALAVCATAAGRVQALATSMHAELREMEHRHGEEVLGDLLRLDHSTAQAGRLADSIAVLTGARSGRRWSRPIPVESVLRGALGRINAYQRVRLHSASGAAVAGYAAEGVMHVLAELMDNAANFSAPPAEVHIYVEELHTGLAITVEDGGLGLSEVWLRRAEQAVSGEPLDLTTLSAGTRLGFAVVGALARKHGLAISFRPSSRGGTGVVMLVPDQLVVRQEQLATDQEAWAAAGDAAGAVPALPSASGLAVAPAVAQAVAQAADVSVDEDGLPRRRRGQTLATGNGTPAPTGAAAPTGTAATGVVAPLGGTLTAARFGAFRQGIRSSTQRADATTPLAQLAPITPDTPDTPKDNA